MTALRSSIAAMAALLAASAHAEAAAKPALGRSCRIAQVGTMSGSLVCTKTGKVAVWKKAPPPSTTTPALDPATAPAGTVLSRETFDSAATSAWTPVGGDGWSGQVVDGGFRIAAAPPAPGRIGLGYWFPSAARAEWNFDLTLTPGAQSLASVQLACQDAGTVSPLNNFLLIDIRANGRLIAHKYDNAAPAQAPTAFFDIGFTNQNRFDTSLFVPGTRVSLQCLRTGADVQVVLSLNGTIVMDTTTRGPTVAGHGFTLYLTTFTTGFRDAAALVVDNSVITKR